MIEGTGIKPAGFIYVAWHSERPGYTKVGYTLWHPRLPCSKYRHGIKRLHRIENYLEAFGFGGLRDWCSKFHPEAERVEARVRSSIARHQRRDVGRNREIYEIGHEDLIALVDRPRRPDRLGRKRARMTTALRLSFVLTVVSGVSACTTTPVRMYTNGELGRAGATCGLALGELAQEEEEPRLLFMMVPNPALSQQQCVGRWARRRSLHLVTLEGVDRAQDDQ